MSIRYQLDASAVLAVIQEEPGGDLVRPLFNTAGIHAFNLAEVYTKLRQKGMPNPEEVVGALQLEVIEELGMKQAADLGKLHAETREDGLSMGDCLCLVTAKSNDAIAVTADRGWVKTMDGSRIQVLCIRGERTQ